MASIVIDSQLSDVADDHEYRTGIRSEGVVFLFEALLINRLKESEVCLLALVLKLSISRIMLRQEI